MKENEGRNGGTLKSREPGDPPLPGVGRKKGGKNWSTLLKQAMKERVSFVDETGETVTMTRKKKIAYLIVKSASDENAEPNLQLKAAAMIIERIEGKAGQTVDLTTKGEAINATPTFTLEIKYEDRGEQAPEQ
jgi:hypothetical protein